MTKNECYGSWLSPIATDLIVKDSVKFLNILSDGDDIYISEMRPEEKGRCTVLKLDNNSFIDMLPKAMNARTKVHEYGGLSFCVNNREIYFSNFSDQQIYKKDLNGNIFPITPISNDRYVNYIVDKSKNLIYCVQEEHLEDEVNNSIVKIDRLGNVTKIAQGSDFYASLAMSPDNKKLAFLSWNFPDMPWDSATLYIADIDRDGNLKNLKKIAGSQNEAIFQPRWTKNSELYFVSDRTNYWNLYRYKNERIESVYPMQAEFGTPMWVFGLSMYDFFYDNSKMYVVAAYIQDGKTHLGIIDPNEKKLDKVETKFTSFSDVVVSKDFAYFIGASPNDVNSLVRLNLQTKKYEILKKSKSVSIDSGYISIPQTIEFPSENNKTAYMIFYPPKNKDYVSSGENPPLIIKSHGGPTARSEAILNLEIQYWTSRGFAFADVNYSGSSGYGREYRQRLYGSWGILDVDDCVNAAKFLIKKNLVDEKRLIIKGGSAGGYTTLCALTFKDIFSAGASYYGVSDIIALVKDTHKFEAKYEEKLVGPYPQEKQLYFDRSPINFIDKLSCPVILFQGEDDKIVPPNQAEMMFDSLKEKKLPTSYLLFEKEGHGFRSSNVIKRAIEAELYFYSKVFGFSIKEEIEPIEIQNLE